MGSFSNKKQLKFVITLGTGTFGSSNNNQITLVGYRASANIDKAGGMMMGTLRAKIYGVQQKDMNSITTLQWKPGKWIPNTVEVYAIDGASETQIFAGNIVNAWGDYNQQPDVFLHIQAQSAFFALIENTPPVSFRGSVDVAHVMQQLAEKLKLTFENNGVNVQLTDIYLPSTGLEQVRDLAQMANIDLYLDDKILAITQRNGTRKTTIPVINMDSGLVGYPTFDGVGVNFKTLYNPAIIFGGTIRIESSITQAAGEWIVTSVAHDLTSETPGGAWFSTVRGNTNGLAITRG